MRGSHNGRTFLCCLPALEETCHRISTTRLPTPPLGNPSTGLCPEVQMLMRAWTATGCWRHVLQLLAHCDWRLGMVMCGECIRALCMLGEW